MLVKLAEMRVVSSDEMPMAILLSPEELQHIRSMPPSDDIFCSVPASWTQKQGQDWLTKRHPDLVKAKERLAKKAVPQPKEAAPAEAKAAMPPGVPPAASPVMTDKQIADWMEATVKGGPVLHAEKRPAQAELKGTFEVAKPEDKK